jgi:hypothetical protein
MPKYKIYVDKNVESDNEVFYDHYAQKQGIVATKLNSYGAGKIYIGKANEGTSTINRMRTLDVDLHLSQNNSIDVVNIDQKLPGGIQALMNNPYNQPFSYIGSGLTDGSTRFGPFVA